MESAVAECHVLSLPLQTLFLDGECLKLHQAVITWHWLPLSLLGKLQASIFHCLFGLPF